MFNILDFTNITYPYAYYPVAVILWLFGCYIASLNKHNSTLILFWMTVVAALWPAVLFIIVLIALAVVALFCAWVIGTHVLYSTVCLPYFFFTGYDEYLTKLSQTVPWNYYKKVKYDNGACVWIRTENYRIHKVKYNTGDVVWFDSYRYTDNPLEFVIKIKTHDGMEYKYWIGKRMGKRVK